MTEPTASTKPAAIKPAVAPVSTAGAGTWDPTGLIGSVLKIGESEEPATPTPTAAAAAAPTPTSTSPASTEAVRESETEGQTPAAPSSIPDGIIPGIDPAEPVVKDSQDDDDDLDTADATTPKAKNAWSKIRSEKKALKQRVKELEDQLSQRPTPERPPEMQELVNMRNQLEEYERKLGQLDLTQTKSFKVRFEIPMERTLQRATAILQKVGFTPDEAKELTNRMLGSSPQEMQQLVSDQPTPVQGALFGLMSEYEQLTADRDEAIKNWKQTRLALEHENTVAEDISLAQDIERDTAAAVTAALESGNWMYRKTEGKSKEWDEAVDERVETVKGLLRTATPAELVKYVVEGITARPLRELLLQERKRADGLAAELKQRQALRPQVRAGGVPPVTGDKKIQPTSPESLIGQVFGVR